MSATQDDIDALRDLQQSRGWLIFSEHLTRQTESDYLDEVSKALNITDGSLALDRLRQVAAVREAGKRWLKYPGERMKQLQQQIEPASTAPYESRRPLGV